MAAESYSSCAVYLRLTFIAVHTSCEYPMLVLDCAVIKAAVAYNELL